MVVDKSHLSKEAQEVLAALEEVANDERAISFIETDDYGRNWFPLDNILNGHTEPPEEDFKLKLNNLHLVLNGNLISNSGHHSLTYYELKKANYTLWVTEQDSFGPLGGAIKNPYADWCVSYG